ncbi:MAG: cyclopropane-fatty-acyl-phospholipid synthase family protein [Hyphomicrobiaceae bacterium]
MSNQDEATLDRVPIYGAAPARPERFGAGILKRLLSGLTYGSLRVVLPTGQEFIAGGQEPGPDALVHLRRWRAVRRLVLGGDLGFAESWIDGDWTSPDLTAVIQLGTRNSAPLASALNGSLALRIANRLRHVMNANTRHGSRRNIEAHYDLGNEFYRLWLDPSMLYSSAMWRDGAVTLEDAQRCKLDRICALLRLEGGERVLEIGCGWGALAVRLASAYDARVTGLTLSPAQLSWAQGLAGEHAVSATVEVRRQDYRDVRGQFDRIVSIEMFEAVGEAYWGDYFATISRCLKPGGTAVLQVISIAEDRYEGYRRGTDFIQKHVFPGGFLPSETALRREVEAAGLVVVAADHFGQSYAQTLCEWRRNFHTHWPEITRLGFDDRFRRLWDYYLCYCEAGFKEGAVDVGLYTIQHGSAG